jgi:hypothetical protein
MNTTFHIVYKKKADDGIMLIVKQITIKNKVDLSIFQLLFNKIGINFKNTKVKYLTIWRPHNKNIVKHPQYHEGEWILVSVNKWITTNYTNAFELTKQIEIFRTIKREDLLKVLDMFDKMSN